MSRQKTPKKGGNSPVLSLRPNIRRFLCSQSSQDHSLINSPVPSPQPARSPAARAPPQSRARDAPRPVPSPGRRHGRDIRDFTVNTCAFPPQRPPCSPPGPGTPPRGGGAWPAPLGPPPGEGASQKCRRKKFPLKFREQYQSALHLHRGGPRGTRPGNLAGGAQAEATSRRRSSPGSRSDRQLKTF